MSWLEWKGWKDYFLSLFRMQNLTYKEFIDTLQNTSYSVEYRIDYFYYHYYRFEDELQKNKKDLYYASDLVTNHDEYEQINDFL